MSRSTSRTASNEREEVDVVEFRKALATGNAKDTIPVTSAGKLYRLLCTLVILTDICFDIFSCQSLRTVPPVLCYCTASILMTIVNKVHHDKISRAGCNDLTNACLRVQFVVSGHQFNMTFLLLCIQSSVCAACVAAVKQMGIISFRDFDMQDAKAWFPISFMLVSVIYTGSKSLVCGNLGSKLYSRANLRLGSNF
jgi:GDP-mannose transporter